MTAYGLALWWGYRTFAVVTYPYLGFTYRTPDALGVLVAAVGLTGLAVLLPRLVRRPGDFMVWFFFAVVIAPAALVPSWTHDLSPHEARVFTVVALTSFALIVVANRWFPLPSWNPPRLRSRDVVLVYAVLSLGTYGSLLTIMGSNLEVTTLTGVRELRILYLERVSQGGPLVAYLVAVQANVANPLLLLRGLQRHSWCLVAIAVLGQVVIYSATGYRTTLLTVPAVLAIAWMARRLGGRIPGPIIPSALGGASILGTTTALTTGWVTLGLLVTVRMLCLPAVIALAHVDTFSDSPKARWAYSFAGPFLDYPYDEVPALMVGNLMTGDSANYANSGFLGDGYANLGYPGVLIEAALLALVLAALNYASRGLSPAVVATMVLAPAMVAANISAFTAILSGGLAATFVAALLMPREGWEESERPWFPLRRRASTSTTPA
ncbi:hypothetical protein [Nocardioides sp. cx-173]|uniref:hypothetical protein n=1 Tax=Nocardioides sp. cx-173 TaxID=2898796 RepID=UPI001E4B1727|nr:hypothetical protein [Nocardioides sp. cx-173]MCD4523766.1 hypothetical protein [Nocardioides sp. cx-173]UGB41910.1 hypothetical protein LQ940_21510 [Nocardioides sp. cx-173]